MHKYKHLKIKIMTSKNLSQAHVDTLHYFKFKNLSIINALKVDTNTILIRFNKRINFYYKNKIKHICEVHNLICESLHNAGLVITF